MINSNELRIGNIVDAINKRYNEKYIIVESVNSECINSDWRPYNFIQLTPIPLTPEVLLAAGFGLSEFQNRMVITYENNKFDIWLYYYKEKCIYSSSCFPDGANPINYLHQLQNLYFALTGTELEIDLTKAIK